MWVDAIRTAFAVIRSPELLLPMSLSKSCGSSVAKPSDKPQMARLHHNVNPENKLPQPRSRHYALCLCPSIDEQTAAVLGKTNCPNGARCHLYLWAQRRALRSAGKHAREKPAAQPKLLIERASQV